MQKEDSSRRSAQATMAPPAPSATAHGDAWGAATVHIWSVGHADAPDAQPIETVETALGIQSIITGGEIRMPTLVMLGDRDTAAMGTGVHTEQSDFLMKHLPSATLRYVEGAAHGFFWQAPERTVEILLEWTASH